MGLLDVDCLVMLMKLGKEIETLKLGYRLERDRHPPLPSILEEVEFDLA